MAKSFPESQIPLIERPHAEPRYFCHIYLPGETLYFSDRNFKFNGHDYEAYVFNIPETAHSIEQFGGYQNLNAQLTFKNKPFRSYDSLMEFFIANPPIFCNLDIFVLYLNNGQTPESDVSTKFHRVVCGEFKSIKRDSFQAELSSIIHSLDNEEIFRQINTTDWPNAAPEAIGKYENLIYGSIRDIPCHCVVTGAVSNLFLDLTATGTTVTLSEVNYPIAFPSSGTIQIDDEKISYIGVNTTNKQLTGCTRGGSGTTPAIHKRGAPVWEVLASYKYLVAGHVCKSAANVKSAQIRLDPATYTVNLNDGGKTTLAFTQKQILRIQGMHTHTSAQSVQVTKYGYSAGREQQGSWTWTGIEQYMRDQNLTTYMRTVNTYEYGGEWARMYVNFLPVNGTIVGATVYLRHRGFGDNNQEGNYIHLRAFWDGGQWESGQLDITGVEVTQSFPLTPPRLITQVDVFCYEGSWDRRLQQDVFEIWVVYEISGVDPSAADGVYGPPAEVIAPQIICDAEGQQDDGSGTYTGTPNALIEVPSDERKHFLIAKCGRTAGEIGASFATARTAYVGRITGGYKFGMILSEIGQKPSQILKALDEQSRSQMREDGGKFELIFHGSTPTPAMTIDKTIYVEDPVFDQTPIFDVRDKIRAVYDIDWSGSSIFTGWKFGRYKKQTERGTGTKILDLEFPAIQLPAMAEDVADWRLSLQQNVRILVSLLCLRKVAKLERDDYFILNDVPIAAWEGLMWRVLSINQVPQKQAFTIRAIRYIES